MSILTVKQQWYRRNREQVIEKARKWRLEHPERYRKLQKEAKRRRRKDLRIEHALENARIDPPTSKLFIPAPGYDPLSCGRYDLWCSARGIDPQKSWDEPTDEFFE